jgi:tricarballylate dehydrogenase
MSLRVGPDARVLDLSGRPFDNIYAAGEIMAGNVLTNGYLGGLGLVIGTLFGAIAGGGGL